MAGVDKEHAWLYPQIHVITTVEYAVAEDTDVWMDSVSQMMNLNADHRDPVNLDTDVVWDCVWEMLIHNLPVDPIESVHPTNGVSGETVSKELDRYNISLRNIRKSKKEDIRHR